MTCSTLSVPIVDKLIVVGSKRGQQLNSLPCDSSPFEGLEMTCDSGAGVWTRALLNLRCPSFNWRRVSDNQLGSSGLEALLKGSQHISSLALLALRYVGAATLSAARARRQCALSPSDVLADAADLIRRLT